MTLPDEERNRNKEEVTFSFGENWKDFVGTVSDQEIRGATRDIEDWLGTGFVSGKTVVDVGSGSGLHSLAFQSLGARQVLSFDADANSVEATRRLWEKAGKPSNWTVSQGSILDPDLVGTLGRFDIVYSWGVLHHTGAMWQAVENCFPLVAPGGKLWLSLYAKGPRYAKDLALKRRYNAASSLGKRWMVYTWIGRHVLGRLKGLQNPFAWSKNRGMNMYHDVVDWLGGLPYEVASEDEVVTQARQNGFVLERVLVKSEGSCNIYVFNAPAWHADTAAPSTPVAS